ncbi:uncharacterized protein H6S33_000928 [Morchella sextelata]|uniref:uncharacterized protein n=1 Tax=Morchella sextelata TaxID=1174677 RepID=UPI001D037194|nr:uncharacterized protein H6S33_000928 [Morchella sextelata]KAH0615292.1 hypothetical protein H6S33_000928 [Morchella sextelata]
MPKLHRSGRASNGTGRDNLPILPIRNDLLEPTPPGTTNPLRTSPTYYSEPCSRPENSSPVPLFNNTANPTATASIFIELVCYKDNSEHVNSIDRSRGTLLSFLARIRSNERPYREFATHNSISASGDIDSDKWYKDELPSRRPTTRYLIRNTRSLHRRSRPSKGLQERERGGGGRTDEEP